MQSEREGKTHAERAAMGATAGDDARLGQSIVPVDSVPADHRPRIRRWEDTFHALALAAGFDGRERGRYEAEAWLTVLDGYVVADVREAIIEHYRRSTYPVMPANVIQIIEDGEPL